MRWIKIWEDFSSSIAEGEISIRLGRSAHSAHKIGENPSGGTFSYTVYNVIVSYDGKDITGQVSRGNSGEDLGNYGNYADDGGHLYVMIPDNYPDIAWVGCISIPKDLRGKGIGKGIYQALANYFRRCFVDSVKYDHSGQSGDGKNFWLNREKICPDKR